MKLVAFLLFAAMMQVSAAGLAQKVTFRQKQATLEQVFKEIKKQTGYDVLYSDQKLNGERTIDADFKDAGLEEVLDQCLAGLSLSYNIEDKTVVIGEREVSLVDRIKTALAIPTIVSGTVQDETNRPLPGVTVRIKGTDNGVVTDVKGLFSLSVPDDKTVITFSYIGYETQELRAADFAKGALITLKAATNNLHEVVINKGYYNERRELSTGDVSVVSAKEIEQQPVSNVLEALEGRIPGLLITQTTGLPGGSFTVQIRGQNSIASGNDPFYVIDGVPYSAQLPASPLNLSGGNPLNYINPYDIESIEVLKDADATAIYGSRAANGAIIITTKKGKAGAMRVDVNVNSGVTEPARTMPLLNTQQYLLMRHEAFKNDGQSPGPTDYDVNGNWDTTRYTNWPKLLANKAAEYTDMQASLSGGNTNTQYLIGGGYNFQKTGFPTLLPGDGGDRRGSAHFNINSTSADRKFAISFTGSYIADKNTVQSTDFTTVALTLPPDAPSLFNPDGTLNWAPLIPGQTGTFNNPYSNLFIRSVNNTANLVSNMVLSYKLADGLQIKTSLGYTNTQANQFKTLPTTVFDPGLQLTSGFAQFLTTNSHSWIIEPQVDYTLHLGKGTLTTTVGSTFNETGSNYRYDTATGFISDALLEDISAASRISTSSSQAQYHYEAVFGRLGFDWAEKYLLNVTARRDGSSRFGPGKQYGNFGAVGVGWIFSKEDFIPKNDFFSFGKLRGSYGITGNDQIGDYQFVDLYSLTTNPYQGRQGLYPVTLFNPDLAWELTRKLEGGIELGFFDNRINIQANFYRNRTNNQLIQTPISAVTGFTSIESNLPALVQNSGKEFILNTINVKTKDFGWSTSFNISAARNKLLAFPNLASSPYQYQLVIGQPISVLKAYHYEGVNTATGLYQFASASGGVTATPNYLTDVRNVDLTPKFYGGFQNSVTYKGFALDFLFQFVKQTGIKLWAINRDIMPGTMFNQPVNVLNRWQQPGDSKLYQQFTQNYGSAAANTFGYAVQSDFAYGDASYIRLKNLALSWQMPQNLAKKMGFSNFRIYLQGQNLLTITNYDGMDPENQNAVTGPRRVYVIGLQLGLGQTNGN